MTNKDSKVAFQRLLNGFKHELRLQGKTLHVLFDSALNSFESKNKATVRANSINDPRLLGSNDHHDDESLGFNILESLEQARISEHAQNIYAGSLFLVLAGWIKTLQDKLEISKKDHYEAGELIRKARLAKLIRATANNFRHYEEWKTPKQQAKDNIAVLNAAGIHGTNLDFICAPQVLQIIQVKTYKELERKVFVVGDDLLRLAKKTNELPSRRRV